MAKATAHCTCRVCGKEFIKEKRNCYNRREADSWESWAERNYNLCQSCWIEEQKQLEKDAGFIAKPRLENPYVDYGKDRFPRMAFVLYGDTCSIKDTIKAIGGVWTDDYPSEDSQFAGGILGNLFDRNYKRWVVWSTFDEYESVVKKLSDAGFNVENVDKLVLAMWLSNIKKIRQMREKDKELKEKEDERKKKKEEEIALAITEKIGNLPTWPQLIKDKWVEGAKWNGKVYGNKGNKSVYFDGEKVGLTDEEAELMVQTKKARDEWRAQKKALEKELREEHK